MCMYAPIHPTPPSARPTDRPTYRYTHTRAQTALLAQLAAVAVAASAPSSSLAQPPLQQRAAASQGGDFLRRTRGGYATSDSAATPVLVPLMKGACATTVLSFCRVDSTRLAWAD